MKTRLVAGLGSLVATTAVVGVPALVGLCGLAVLLLGFASWVVASKARTTNTVALITAARPDRPTPPVNGSGPSG